MAAILLAGCDEASDSYRPQSKPEALSAAIAGSDGRPQTARVATGRGEILLRDLEGGVRPVPLNSREGQRALAGSEADLARAEASPEAGTPAVPRSAAASPAEDPDDQSAQERLVSDFEAQRGPVLPERALTEADGGIPDPSIFLGTRVAELQPGQTPQIAGGPRQRGAARVGGPALVEVTANLKQGVDADTAFAYATCALAGWAARTGTPFARHIRTLQQSADGRLRVASVFTISQTEPMGLRVIEAQTTLGECKTRGIPAA